MAEEGAVSTAHPSADGGAGREGRVLRRLLRNRMVLVGGSLVLAMVLGAVFAPLLASQDPLQQETANRVKPPFWETGDLSHPLGTDPVGRDVLSRVLHGSRISLTLGIVAVLVSGTVGTLLGLLAGYYERHVGDLVMRLADVQLSFPVILLAISVVAVVGRSLPALVAVLAFSGWVVYARTVRGSVLSLKEKDFIEAGRALGSGNLRILFRHILPNCMAPLLVIATVQMATMIILESGLSFFGLGTQPPAPSWGGMLAEGREYLIAGAWWLTAFPGLAISITVLGINLLGDGLRDVLDPQLQNY
jgi:peptide/nickel transport system permease protein